MDTSEGLDPSIQSVIQCCIEPKPPVWPFNGEPEPVVSDEEAKERREASRTRVKENKARHAT